LSTTCTYQPLKCNGLEACWYDFYVGELFTGKEWDQEGESQENGVDGIQQYYFGSRYYDPVIGDFTSGDVIHQFHNAYQYTNRNPVSHFDVDGLFDPFSHLLVGGWDNMMVDWWHKKGGTSGQEDIASIAHGPSYDATGKATKEDRGLMMLALLRADSPADLANEESWSEWGRSHGIDFEQINVTGGEWEAAQQHAALDFLNEGPYARPISPLQTILEGIDPTLRQGYQDIQGALVLGGPFVAGFVPGSEILIGLSAIDWLISSANLAMWQRFVSMFPEYALFPEYFATGELDIILHNRSLGGIDYHRAQKASGVFFPIQFKPSRGGNDAVARAIEREIGADEAKCYYNTQGRLICP